MERLYKQITERLYKQIKPLKKKIFLQKLKHLDGK